MTNETIEQRATRLGVRWKNRKIADIVADCDIAETPSKLNLSTAYGNIEKPVINRIERKELEDFRVHTTASDIENELDAYQRIAIQSAIYPGKGTPFGLMYAALGLAEAGEVQNKVKKAFRDDGVVSTIFDAIDDATGRIVETRLVYGELTPERKAQIIKELGGVLWYVAAVCDEIGATMSEVALQNLDELCSRGERGTLRGDGDNR